MNPIGADSKERGLQDSGLHSAGFWATLAMLVCWGLIACVANLRYHPPAPLPVDAESNLFSAARAELILKELVGDGIPHPAGSKQNDVVRERILSLVESWGYEPQVQETENFLYRDPKREVVALENIMFRKNGSGHGKAVLLVAHYDSRPEGPGASDDGVGLSAVLEIARMFSAEPEFERDLIFLITDGEEFNLLGVDKWCSDHPWANEVDVAINLEARGTSGGSLMFETSSESRWLIELFSQVSERPLTSSLFYEVYRFLPNDTDFTLLKKAGIQGYNFAFIGDVRNYHTPQDSVENVDLGSLQHHGQNALALVRELLVTDFEMQPQGRAVYFDVFGSFVVRWPASWSIWLSVFAFLLVVSKGRLVFKNLAKPLRELFLQAGIALLILLMVLGVCVAVGFGLKMDQRLEIRWLDCPLPVELAYWFAAVASLSFSSFLIDQRLQPVSLLLVTAGGWSLMAIAASLFFNGGSFLFLVPALAIAVGIHLFGDKNVWLAGCLVGAIHGIVWIPMEQLFYDALGFVHPSILGVRIVLAMTVLLPILSCSGAKGRWAMGWIGIAGFVASVIAAILLNSAG